MEGIFVEILFFRIVPHTDLWLFIIVLSFFVPRRRRTSQNLSVKRWKTWDYFILLRHHTQKLPARLVAMSTRTRRLCMYPIRGLRVITVSLISQKISRSRSQGRDRYLPVVLASQWFPPLNSTGLLHLMLLRLVLKNARAFIWWHDLPTLLQ